MSTKAGIV